MLRAASAFVAWSKIEKEQLVKLLRTRGYISKGKVRRMTDEDVKQFGFESIEALAEQLLQGKIKWSKIEWVKHTFNLALQGKASRGSLQLFTGLTGCLQRIRSCLS